MSGISLNPFRLFGRRKRRRTKSRLRWTVSWLLRLLPLFIAVDVAYLAHIWPDWGKINKGSIPKSVFIERYENDRKQDPSLNLLRWNPVPYHLIPRHVRHAAVAAEDARFFSHNGIDVLAFRDAMESNLERLELKYGGSTISQQTVKNLFLSPSRNPLRKWHELILTFGMEFKLRKRRILEIYLNIAEFGEGVYGVEAAARHYWDRPVSALSEWEAAQLAASLPSPKKHNPSTQTRRFLKRSRKIFGFLKRQVYNHPAG